MIKIAITDDHPLLLEGLKNILSQQENFMIVGCYSSSTELFKGLENQALDVLLLDINLSDGNSIDLIKPILKKYPAIQIMILSVHNEFAVINSTLEEGAMGYIQKNALVSEIILGIQTILKGEKFLCNQTKKIVEMKANSGLNTIPKLTRREKEILQEASLGLTTIQIADKLCISPHTVESHRKNLIAKFKTTNISTAVKLAMEYGLV
ncbi:MULTISPECIES: response regulator transcription factor [Chryseobacterium]|uniref:LuxR family two component transcriptional regulator n=1 Tax=Chryseobacterium geocarposphaerae TaxID=1416776 RepID=A0A2M9C9E5_9FLAO|nr:MULTISPECIES: response regulator transcription factor [Chryseobacterium]MPS66772.1 response regulator transcription factor [Chryseobacterium sp.]PJJ67402.1 LuxR family two component transcriptional regulator [Chryseobacterium geocarposphaerae]PZU23059.1 MAG: DNA-binding response regulator [Chryseobacterium sp.]